MELAYFGANCLRITSKKAQIVVDDNLKNLDLKSATKQGDIVLQTSKKINIEEGSFNVDMPGEYETAGVVIQGTAARAHMDKEGEQSAVIYTITSEGTKIAILGHIYPDLSDEQLEQIGTVDIAIVPVGNSGYTLDGAGALKVIKKIEPKVVIPTHYADKNIKYEVPQTDLAEALKNLGMEASETVDRYKFKAVDVTDTTHLVVLNRQ